MKKKWKKMKTNKIEKNWKLIKFEKKIIIRKNWKNN